LAFERFAQASRVETRDLAASGGDWWKRRSAGREAASFGRPAGWRVRGG
jgi:hypothetical protein